MSAYATSNAKSILQRAQHIMSTISVNSDSASPSIQQILSFWFDHPDAFQRWFKYNAAFDAEIKTKFGDLVNEARLPSSTLNNWTSTTDGALALLILLDQFPRNIFRGSAEAFSSDATARDVAVAAIAKGYDRQVPSSRAIFFYLPLGHGESLLDQVAAVSLFEGLMSRAKDDDPMLMFLQQGFKSAEQHRNAIMRWGRFPARNEAMGRKSTDEEIEFLKDHPFGM